MFRCALLCLLCLLCCAVPGCALSGAPSHCGASCRPHSHRARPPAPLPARSDPWPSVQSLPNFLLGFQGPRAPPNANSGAPALHDRSSGPACRCSVTTMPPARAGPLSSPRCCCLALPRLQAWRCTGSFSVAAGTSTGPRAACCAPTHAASGCAMPNTRLSRRLCAPREWGCWGVGGGQAWSDRHACPAVSRHSLSLSKPTPHLPRLHAPRPARRRCTLSAEGPHNFRHNCTQPVLQTDKTPIHGARSEEPGACAVGGVSGIGTQRQLTWRACAARSAHRRRHRRRFPTRSAHAAGAASLRHQEPQ